MPRRRRSTRPFRADAHNCRSDRGKHAGIGHSALAATYPVDSFASVGHHALVNRTALPRSQRTLSGNRIRIVGGGSHWFWTAGGRSNQFADSYEAAVVAATACADNLGPKRLSRRTAWMLIVVLVVWNLALGGLLTFLMVRDHASLALIVPQDVVYCIGVVMLARWLLHRSRPPITAAHLPARPESTKLPRPQRPPSMAQRSKGIPEP